MLPATEIKTSALLSLRSDLQWNPYAALSLRAAGHGIVSPLRIGSALVGLYQNPEVWLVLSWSFDPPDDLDPAHHLDRLLRDEPDLIDNAALTWLETPLRIRQSKRSFTADMWPGFLRSLYSVLGDPEEDGRWLAYRLMPRRIPAALRVHPDHFQLWLSL